VLPVAHRLRRSREIDITVRRGVRSGRRLLVVHLGAGDDARPPAAAFTVSKAVGPAVTRNRVKRRLRHVVASRLADLSPGSRLVVRALPPAAAATSDELAADVDAALASATRRLRSGP
jgi:ribonuclease P protein component